MVIGDVKVPGGSIIFSPKVLFSRNADARNVELMVCCAIKSAKLADRGWFDRVTDPVQRIQGDGGRDKGSGGNESIQDGDDLRGSGFGWGDATRAEAWRKEYGIGVFGFDGTRIQASKQQEGQDNHENQKLQTGQSSEGFLRVRGDQWTTAHVAVLPTLVGVSKRSTTSAQSGVTIPCGVRPPRCNRSRSASSTESQTVWEGLAATAVYALLVG